MCPFIHVQYYFYGNLGNGTSAGSGRGTGTGSTCASSIFLIIKVFTKVAVPNTNRKMSLI